jgi:hypothetical protein
MRPLGIVERLIVVVVIEPSAGVANQKADQRDATGADDLTTANPADQLLDLITLAQHRLMVKDQRRRRVGPALGGGVQDVAQRRGEREPRAASRQLRTPSSDIHGVGRRSVRCDLAVQSRAQKCELDTTSSIVHVGRGGRPDPVSAVARELDVLPFQALVAASE